MSVMKIHTCHKKNENELAHDGAVKGTQHRLVSQAKAGASILGATLSFLVFSHKNQRFLSNKRAKAKA